MSMIAPTAHRQAAPTPPADMSTSEIVLSGAASGAAIGGAIGTYAAVLPLMGHMMEPMAGRELLVSMAKFGVGGSIAGALALGVVGTTVGLGIAALS